MRSRWQLLAASAMAHCCCALGDDPLTVQALPVTNSPAAPSRVNQALPSPIIPHGELALTGLIELTPIRRAFIERQTSGSGRELYSLTPGQTQGGIELIAIRAAEGEATVRYRGTIVELSLVASATAAADGEKARDHSHTAYHTHRARLDRERDAHTN